MLNSSWNNIDADCCLELLTSGSDVVEVERFGSHHDLVADDSEAVDVSTLSSTSCWIVLT